MVRLINYKALGRSLCIVHTNKLENIFQTMLFGLFHISKCLYVLFIEIEHR